MGGGIEYAPQALYGLFGLIKQRIPQAELGGIQGDKAHTYGYHRARAVVPSSDYSVRESPLDRDGDPWACSALDVTLGSTPLMHTVSQRLLDAKNDPRMKGIVREFFGSVDGKSVCGWDWLRGSTTTSSDMSHLWHVHLSIHRKYATDLKVLAPIADVLAGSKEDDMPTAAEIWSAPIKGRDGVNYTAAKMLTTAAGSAADASALAASANARAASAQAAIDALTKQLATVQAQVADLIAGKITVAGSLPATITIGGGK